MAELNLPDRLKQGLALLSAAGDAAASELQGLANSVQPSFVSNQFVESLRTKATTWAPPDFDLALGAIIGLILTRKPGEDLSSFVDNVVSTMVKVPLQKGGTDQDQIDATRLRERLLSVLSLDGLVTSARAFEVLTSHQKVLLSCRVFSDVRHVFREPVTAGPSAAVVIHQLKVEYREDGERQEIFFAMDSKDLVMLAELVARASEKEKVLRKMLKDAGMPFIEPR